MRGNKMARPFNRSGKRKTGGSKVRHQKIEDLKRNKKLAKILKRRKKKEGQG